MIIEVILLIIIAQDVYHISLCTHRGARLDNLTYGTSGNRVLLVFAKEKQHFGLFLSREYM